MNENLGETMPGEVDEVEERGVDLAGVRLVETKAYYWTCIEHGQRMQGIDTELRSRVALSVHLQVAHDIRWPLSHQAAGINMEGTEILG